MWDYLDPTDGPVIAGLENEELEFAKNQPEYRPLRTLASNGPMRQVISRWTLTPEQRQEVYDGADIFLELSTFGQPLQPIRIAVSDGIVDPNWVRVCLLERPARGHHD